MAVPAGPHTLKCAGQARVAEYRCIIDGYYQYFLDPRYLQPITHPFCPHIPVFLATNHAYSCLPTHQPNFPSLSIPDKYRLNVHKFVCNNDNYILILALRYKINPIPIRNFSSYRRRESCLKMLAASTYLITSLD